LSPLVRAELGIQLYGLPVWPTVKTVTSLRSSGGPFWRVMVTDPPVPPTHDMGTDEPASTLVGMVPPKAMRLDWATAAATKDAQARRVLNCILDRGFAGFEG